MEYRQKIRNCGIRMPENDTIACVLNKEVKIWNINLRTMRL